MVVDPLTRLVTNGHSSSHMLAKTKSERKEERPRSLVRKVTPCGKNKPHRGVRKSNQLPAGGGWLRGFFHCEDKGSNTTDAV